jgi:hypothetical protein
MEVVGRSEGDAVGSCVTCAWAVSRDTANTSNDTNSTRLTAGEQMLLAWRLLEDDMAAKDFCKSNTQR